jgi:DNA repair exonuclease SbcCD ATPase subunit
MFSAYKRKSAERKAARAKNTQEFKAKLAAIDARHDEFKAAMQTAKENNRQALKAELAANKLKLKAAWTR